jgi:phenylalanyl-tRNA synthetase beta chain
VLGLVSRAVAEKAGLRHVPAAVELELQPLLANTRHVPQLQPLPRFPAVERDVSLILADTVRYEQIVSTLAGLNLADLESCRFVTTYRGKPLEKGTKSVTVKLMFRSAERSLVSEQVDGSVTKFVEAARSGLAATLRT